MVQPFDTQRKAVRKPPVAGARQPVRLRTADPRRTRAPPRSSRIEDRRLEIGEGRGDQKLRRKNDRRFIPSRRSAAVLALAGFLLGGCFTQTYQRGYLLPEGAIEQIQLGASQEQVLIILGTPSTVATVSGEVFYYISQKAQQTSFLPQREVDRRVIAVYFDKGRKVERLANYGIKDGRVFDFVSRTTPTGGQELNYVQYILKAITL
jgi:outer membrane protein assembly factor BamE (lipoprotein component of BamABCDE complex)